MFDSNERHEEMLYDVAKVELHDVPIGFAILSVWLEVEGPAGVKPNESN